MNWPTLHSQSETYASQAEAVRRRGEIAEAERLYTLAAEAESDALQYLDKSKKRTLGVSAVSAVALWYKARRFDQAQQTAHAWLAAGELPAFAADQLRELLQAIWNEVAKDKAKVGFAPGQVIVSIKGGEVLPGGAPLDLIVEKVQTVQSLFYRTAELIRGSPHRTQGVPDQAIRDMCRPWLFQAIPGSYQFAIAVQEPAQLDLFPTRIARPDEIASLFLQILRAAAESPDTDLPSIVPAKDYQNTFLKLARNLAPTGKSFQSMEVRSPEMVDPITLLPAVRTTIGQALKRERKLTQETAESEETGLTGVLRAVHLDQDWLEISTDEGRVRIINLGEAVDDVIGPMVNRPVIVRTTRDAKGRPLFRDIESAE